MKLRVENVEGSVRVDRIVPFAQNILQLAKQHPRLHLNISRLEEIDLSFVHVIYAAKRWCDANKVEFHLSGTVQESVGRKLVAGGFCDHIPQEAADLEANLVGFSAGDDNG